MRVGCSPVVERFTCMHSVHAQSRIAVIPKPKRVNEKQSSATLQ